MALALTCHPESHCTALTRIDVDVTRPRAHTLVLRYAVTGTMGALRMPPVTAPSRADALWQHTCFEAFICLAPDAAYYEFNFSPSTQWAAYRFSTYREKMRVAHEVRAPHIDVNPGDARYELQASLELDQLTGFSSRAIWHLGLSAVIEEASGRKSYWALAHPPGKPDFHHSDCFTHKLPAASQP